MRPLFIVIAVLICNAAFAQKYVPIIKAGTIITYNVSSSATGQQALVTLTVNSLADPVKLKWEIAFVGTGTLEMTQKAMQSATKLIAREPNADEVTRLADDETVAVLSKAIFNNLVNNKAFELNKTMYTVKTDTAANKINDKAADIFYAESKNGHKKIWVLNNPDFPLIYKEQGVTGGIVLELTTITGN